MNTGRADINRNMGNRSKRVTVRFSPEERDRIAAFAEDNNVLTSAALRWLIGTALGQAARKPAPRLDHKPSTTTA
jgi:hypothetical protein